MKRSILSIKDISPRELPSFFDLVDRCAKGEFQNSLSGKVMASLFFEPSTRTRLSFESAMIRLGGSVIGFQEGASSSMSKGESLSDTIRMISEYADLIVLRHPLIGSSRLAARLTERPVINAGDGSFEHPTQTLVDLYTMQSLFGRLEGLKIAIMGDPLHARTAHSLVLGLIPFSPRLYFVSSKELIPPETLLEELRENSIKFSFHEHLSEVIGKIDLLYMTRLQKERHRAGHELNSISYTVNKKSLEEALSHLKVLHPLPRSGELSHDIDETPFQAYFTQAKNGLIVRQALCMRSLCQN